MSTKQTSTKCNQRSQEIKHALQKAGYLKPGRIATTLQGSIWRASVQISPTHRQSVIAKVTDKELHSKSMVIIEGKEYIVDENIMKEMSVQKYLTENAEECPDSIVRYLCSFATDKDIYLIMEDGGSSLFSFIVKGHELVKDKTIEIIEWQRVIKVIFKQMVECIEYIHSKNVCHMDISCENWLINDVPVEVQVNSDGSSRVRFCCEKIQVKLCDFGLAEKFNGDSFESSKYCGKPNYKSPEIISRNKRFDAKSNDIWCLGICLFMMIIGSNPWTKASVDNPTFNYIVHNNNNNRDGKENVNGLIELLDSWNVLKNVNMDLIVLIQSIFKYEGKRCKLSDIKNCSWLRGINK